MAAPRSMLMSGAVTSLTTLIPLPADRRPSSTPVWRSFSCGATESKLK